MIAPIVEGKTRVAALGRKKNHRIELKRSCEETGRRERCAE